MIPEFLEELLRTDFFVLDIVENTLDGRLVEDVTPLLEALLVAGQYGPGQRFSNIPRDTSKSIRGFLVDVAMGLGGSVRSVAEDLKVELCLLLYRVVLERHKGPGHRPPSKSSDKLMSMSGKDLGVIVVVA